MTVLVPACLVAAAVLVVSPASAAPRLARLQPGPSGAGAAAVAFAAAARSWRRAWAGLPSRRRQGREATSDAVVELLESFAADLLVGRPAVLALAGAIDDVADAVLAEAGTAVRRALRIGGDVPAALTSAAVPTGCEPLRWLAAGWRLAESTGAGLATVVAQVAASARGEAEHRREVEAQLAAPRATARLLAVLPAMGLLVGELVGAGPVSVLLGSPAGWACLVAGLTLDVVGLRWTDRLARTAAGS